MKQSQSYYEVLGVSQSAEDVVIKASYRALAQKYHPDKSTDPLAAAKMVRINAAYAVLSDSRERQRYDSEENSSPSEGQSRQRQPSTPRPEAATSQKAEASNSALTLAEYLDSCGVKNITSDHIFFQPNIPAKKMSGARSAYASGIAERDILVLIDDTVFGGAKDGLVITRDRLIFKEKFGSAVSFELDDIKEVSCEENNLVVNGRKLGSFTLVEKLGARYVLHEISSFLTAFARSQAEAKRPVSPALDIDVQELGVVFRKHIAPVPFKSGEDLSRFHGRYPGYHVGQEIPHALERTVRFALSIPDHDQLLAVIDLWDGQGEAVAFTNRGVCSRCRVSDTVTAYEWSTLKGSSVKSEFEKSVFDGIIFDDGRQLICGRKNAVLRPFGSRLISDLLQVLPRALKTPSQRGNDLLDVLHASIQGFKSSLDEDGEGSADDEVALERIVLYFLERQITIVGNALTIEASRVDAEEFLVRIACAQFFVFLLAMYSASLVPAATVTAIGKEVFLGIAAQAMSYFEYCRDKNNFAESLPDFISELYDPELSEIVAAALLSEDERFGSEQQRLMKKSEFVEGMLKTDAFQLRDRERELLIAHSKSLTREWLNEVARFEREDQR